MTWVVLEMLCLFLKETKDNNNEKNKCCAEDIVLLKVNALSAVNQFTTYKISLDMALGFYEL